MEADDDRIRGLGEQHVGIGDGAHAAVHHLDLDLGRRQLRQSIRQRFRRAALVGLDDDPQRRRAALGALGHEVLERLHPSRATVLRLALEPLALLRDVARRRRVGHDLEGVARLRHAFEAQHLHRRGRTRARHGLPALVVHRPHPAIELPADEVVPTAQRAVLDEDRGERTLAGVERRLEHGALRAPLGVGLEIE